ncbi:hypothetical protein BURPS1710A_2063 [Burkholderia pseudomallei 1710a]|uniref:Uncharacterized protein n=1 Tax=Burkholderia pseudomallei 1710a TaxID=320371 RepID=A0A0E1W6X7_BURPE|nr:hypothetical protein BURPS1655_A2159 [Burkholderia pseudomallei 1655]EET08923.1 hypothetical protein BURPS1710A_2063 [Burkholderia pseudomallei 1710a]
MPPRDTHDAFHIAGCPAAAFRCIIAIPGASPVSERLT